MINQLYEQVLAGIDVRKNLINIKEALKDAGNKSAFRYLLADNFAELIKLLNHEDAKVRKNVALILGEMGSGELASVLFEAYQKEEQRFVKSSYLKALMNYDYNDYLTELKERYEELSKEEVEENSQKHMQEEVSFLQKMLLEKEKPKPHVFTGYDKSVEVILLMNRFYKEITASQIEEGQVQDIAAGLRVKTNNLRAVLQIRTFTELLFTLKCLPLDKEPQVMAKQLKEAGLLELLESLHSKELPFYFRIQLKNRMDLEKRGSYTKQIAYQIEQQNKRKLINSTSNYEVELRLIENKEGNYFPLLKLYTLKDNRFAYREEVIASSISPVNAALMVNLAKKYLKEDAQILDPFCGVGTMLIERNKLLKANPIYGIEIFQDAIEKARRNTRKDRTIINYIQRDFFDFHHDYDYDEIITNMPARGNVRNKEEIDDIYRKFFPKADELLQNKGIILLYSNERELLKKNLQAHANFQMLEEFIIDERNKTYLFVIEKL